MISRAQIAGMMPHGESMCMLDEIVEWDEHRLVCRIDPARGDNPLSEGDRLHGALLVEHAAQAAAVHGALCGDDTNGPSETPALLGAVKRLAINQHPNMDQDLFLQASCIIRRDRDAIYDFVVRQGEQVLVQGQLVLYSR